MKVSHTIPIPPTGEILLVEDDPALNKVLSMQLKAHGFNYRSALGGAEALRMLEDRMPALLILDVLMPEINGFEIIEALRRKIANNSLITMIHTAADLDENEKNQLTLGQTVFVTKTKSPEDICQLATALLKEAT